MIDRFSWKKTDGALQINPVNNSYKGYYKEHVRINLCSDNRNVSLLFFCVCLHGFWKQRHHSHACVQQHFWLQKRTSQEPHSSGLSLTSQIGPSKYLGEVRSHNI